jgi:hypothetical protein
MEVHSLSPTLLSPCLDLDQLCLLVAGTLLPHSEIHLDNRGGLAEVPDICSPGSSVCTSCLLPASVLMHQVEVDTHLQHREDKWWNECRVLQPWLDLL